MAKTDFNEHIRPSWVDLPSVAALGDIAGVADAAAFRELLTNYHGIAKDKVETLSSRCAQLNRIADYCSRNRHDHSMYSGFAYRAAAKAKYLLALKKLYSDGTLTEGAHIYDEEALSSRFNRFAARRSGYKPLVLSNALQYDPYNGHFWGTFWIEAIDPCHRPLEEYAHKWREEKKNRDVAPFFLWLETQDVSAHHKRIDFLNAAELKDARLHVQQGLLVKADRKLGKSAVTTAGRKEALFVITQDEKLCMIYGEGNYRHISLSHGKAVIAAGEIKIEDGKITELFTNSGHYLPPADFVPQMLKAFENIGVILDPALTLKYFSNEGIVTTPLKDFSSKSQRALYK